MSSSDLMTIDNAIAARSGRSFDQNPALVYLAALGSEHSRRAMRGALDTIAGMIYPDGNLGALTFPWEVLRYQHTSAIRSQLQASHYKPSSANLFLAALRGVLKECWQLGLMTAEDYHRAIAVKAVRGETLPAGRELTAGEIDALFRVCNEDHTPAGRRDGAILAVLRYGLRRAEVVTLELNDFDPDKGGLRIMGKGKKERAVYLPDSAAEYVRRWLAVRGTDAGALFVAINKGGNIRGYSGLSSQAIYDMLKKRAGQAGVKDFSPHDFRRTFAGDSLQAGADIAIVSKLMGHASIETTAKYDRRPDDAKRKAAALIHVPAPGQ